MSQNSTQYLRRIRFASMTIQAEDRSHCDAYFNHEFSGWSVWIELDKPSALLREMEYLRQAVGGTESGVHRFPPHLTLLYNFQMPGNENDHERAAEEMLRASLGDFLLRREDQFEKGQLRRKLEPEKWMYFDYPTSADGGNGFGASLSLLLLRKTDSLTKLHQKIRQQFPSDQRSASFQPHVSLVYAPRCHGPHVEKRTLLLQRSGFMLIDSTLNAKCVSVWKTCGQTKDWRRIAQVPI